MNKLKNTEIKKYKLFFKKLVDEMSQYGHYSQVLFLHKIKNVIQKDDKETDSYQLEDFGVKLRLFTGEHFLEYGTSLFDQKLLKKEAAKLAKRANKIKVKNPLKIPKEDKFLDKNFSTKSIRDPRRLSLKSKIKLLEDIHGKVSGKSKTIINTRAVYSEYFETKIFVSEDRALYQDISGCRLIVMPIVQTQLGEIRYHFEGFFEPGCEVFDLKPKQIKDIVHKANKVAEATKIKSGKYTVIMSPEVAGLLAHESFGHGFEADTLFKGRAKAEEYLGKEIASEQVSILDNPSLEGRNGSYFFDDEGQLANETYLIKNGIVKSPITDMYSAIRLNKERTANGRLESFDHKPYSRMSNTYFAPGNEKKESMLSSVRDGFYLHYSSGGMEDPKGWGVQIQGVLAERIFNGKLTGEFFYEVGITGFLPEILINIQGVGKKLEVKGAGSCGKGHKEWVRVSEGGPHLKVKNLDLA
jgi:TldD protein